MLYYENLTACFESKLNFMNRRLNYVNIIY